MASPAWFFSTLAQASAAIIALTIAFTITSYSTGREYIQAGQTDSVRNSSAIKRSIRESWTTWPALLVTR